MRSRCAGDGVIGWLGFEMFGIDVAPENIQVARNLRPEFADRRPPLGC